MKKKGAKRAVNGVNGKKPGSNLATNTRSPSLFALLLAGAAVTAVAIVCHTGSWVLPENFFMRAFLLKDGFAISSKSIATALDYRIMENSPRITRPLSNFVDLLEAKFRASLWRLVEPQAWVSIPLLLNIFLFLPLIWVMMSRLEMPPDVKIVFFVLLLSSQAFLSHLCCNFRSGKAILCSLAAIQLFLCLIANKHQKTGAAYYRTLASIGAVALFSLLLDEAGLFNILTPLILIRGALRRGSLLLILSAAFVLAVSVVFIAQPALLKAFGIPVPGIADYAPLRKPVFSAESASTIMQAFVLALRESLFFGIGGSSAAGLALDILCVIFVVLLGCAVIKRSHGTEKGLFARICLLIALGAFLHAYMMQRVDNKVWGLYYYGTFIAPAASMFAAFLIKDHLTPAVSLLMLALLVCRFMSFVPLNTAYRDLHYYPHDPLRLRKVFTGEISRFSWRDKAPPTEPGLAYKVWKDLRDKKYDISIANSLPRHLLYVPIETAPGVFTFSLHTMWGWGEAEIQQEPFSSPNNSPLHP